MRVIASTELHTPGAALCFPWAAPSENIKICTRCTNPIHPSYLCTYLSLLPSLLPSSFPPSLPPSLLSLFLTSCDLVPAVVATGTVFWPQLYGMRALQRVWVMQPHFLHFLAEEGTEGGKVGAWEQGQEE